MLRLSLGIHENQENSLAPFLKTRRFLDSFPEDPWFLGLLLVTGLCLTRALRVASDQLLPFTSHTPSSIFAAHRLGALEAGAVQEGVARSSRAERVESETAPVCTVIITAPLYLAYSDSDEGDVV